LRKVAGGLTVALALGALSGCGKSEAEKEAAAGGRGPLTCKGSAMGAAPELPAGFPSVGNITFVSSSKEGPTTVADGYTKSDLKTMHDGYVSGFESAGYSILFEELEDRDSEVSYKTKDGSKTGQVALRECENDNTSVHITIRPA
jgi:hypothetical protein